MDLSPLVPVKKYDADDYLDILKALFPFGKFWNFILGEVGEGEQTYDFIDESGSRTSFVDETGSRDNKIIEGS